MCIRDRAEKASPVFLNHLSSVGVFGRLWMSGGESDILAARNAAVGAIEAITGPVSYTHLDVYKRQILAFGIQKPAFRILVNTWGSLGGVGATTGIKPSMTLAPGGMGGAVISDNVSVEHVLNIKRIAYHLHDAPAVAQAWKGGPSAASAFSAPGHLPQRSSDAEMIERVVHLVLKEMGR